MKSAMTIVETNGLSKTYRSGYLKKSSIDALKNVSLQVQAGEIFGLLGPNGAGKTTFVKLLLSIVRPTNGEGLLLGEPIGDKKARASCGYLPENHRYPNFLTARETLRLFGELSGVPRSVLKNRSEEMLELVGLKNWAGQKVSRFSKGMLQRLGLAQALINTPRVLFLDEPTDGVDPVGRKEMRDFFLRLKSDGVTIFLNSHLLSEVELVCTRVAILNKGALIRIGTLDEVRGGQTTHHIQIQGTLNTDQEQVLQAYAQIVSSDANTTRLTVQTESELNRTIDLLRSWGLMISSISQQKTSLEDTFVKLVSNEGVL